MAWRTGYRALGGIGLLLAVCSSGCGLEKTGDAIFDPDRSHVDAPGQRIAKGHYTRVGVDPFGPEGPALVGFRLDRETPSLAIAPFSGAEGCEVQPAQAYGVMLPGTEPVRLLPYLERIESSGRGTLRFIDHGCRQHHRSIEDARLPLHSLKDGQGFVTRVGNDLVLIDPWRETETIVSRGFAHHEYSFGHHWLVEDGKLVVIDDEMSPPVLSAGSEITELMVLGQTVAQAVFVDAGDLYVLEDVSEPPHRVHEDVCEVASLASQRMLVYRSPCDGGSLTVLDLVTGSTTLHEVPAPPHAFRLVRGRGDEIWTYYLTEYDTTNRVGTLWIDPPDADPIRVGERADLSWVQLVPTSAESKVLGSALIDVDGVRRAGRFVEIDVDGNVREVAAGVARAFRSGLLINFDGMVGDLAPWPAWGGSATVEAHGVPVHPFAVNGDLLSVPVSDGPTPSEAFLTEYSASVGTLVAKMVADGGKVSYGQRRVSDNVPIGGFQMLQIIPALAYMTDFDTARGVGRLELWNHELDVVLPVHPSVSEFEEVIWPHDGILYNVPEGADAGIWFARAK